MDESDIEQLAAEEGLASWTFVGGVYGSPRQVTVDKAEIKRSLSPVGRLLFVRDSSEKALKGLVSRSRNPEI